MDISVIVPVYNVEKYVEECLQSLLSETRIDIEVICINDCSVDNSYRIICAMAEKDDRIKVIENECNMGLSYTRNKGTKIATGKYILYVDSDDMLRKGALYKLYQTAEESDTDVVFF